MKKPQWVALGVALLIVAGLYAATQQQLFGPPKPHQMAMPPMAMDQETIPTDSILFYAKQNLSPAQVTRLNSLEHSITRGDVKEQQLHLYHQLAAFWADTAKLLAPYAWYTGEAARLENSEKSLTFAARLFLNSLTGDGSPEIKKWAAVQAKDLFERSLKLNPNNDSSKVGLGSVYIYGGIAMPMQGIGMIREVADRDSNNVYAQWALGEASMFSGQTEKAADRFARVVRLQPNNPEALLRLADAQEQMGNKTEAISWYTKVLPMIDNADIRKEVQARIAELKK